MNDRANEYCRIELAGKRVKLPVGVHAEIQSLVDACHDRHAIARLREATKCDHESACDALLDPANFDQEARRAMIARDTEAPAEAAATHEGGLFDRLADQFAVLGRVRDAIEQVTDDTRDNTSNQIKLTVAGVAVLITLVMLIVRMVPSHSPGNSGEVFYYDTGTGELFTDNASTVVPISAPSGKQAGVRAFVFSCGSCRDSSQRFVGYLQKHSPELNAAFAQRTIGQPPQSALAGETGRKLIRDAEGDQWVPEGSPEAMAVLARAAGRCSGNALRQCKP